MIQFLDEPLTETEIGALPTDWGISTLADLFEIQQGKALNPKARAGKCPKPFLRTANVFWGYLDLSTLDEMDFNKDEVERLTLRLGDLLVCEGGDIGRTAMWEGQAEGCMYQNHLHRLRRRQNLEPAFYMYWMQAAINLLGLYTGHGNKTTIPNLSKRRLGSLAVPVPPLTEQRAIAQVLRTVQEAKRAAEKVIAATRQLKQSLMRHLFTYGPVRIDQAGKVELKETEDGTVPSHWHRKKFQDFATLQRGKDLPRYSFQVGHVPVIGATSIIGFHNEANVKGPGVTVVRSGSSAGKPLYIDRDFWAHNVVLYVKDFHGNNVKFVYYKILCLRLMQFRAGVAVPTLNRNTFKSLMIAIPPRHEQDEIVRSLDAAETKIEAETARKSALDALFQTLLHQLMTGRVRAKAQSVLTEAATLEKNASGLQEVCSELE